MKAQDLLNKQSALTAIVSLSDDFKKQITVLENHARNISNQNLNTQEIVSRSIFLKGFEVFLHAFGILAQTIENGSIVIATAIIDSKDNKETGK